MTFTGPYRTIIVEPVELPEQPEPTPARQPEREPAREPDETPERESEPVPAKEEWAR